MRDYLNFLYESLDNELDCNPVPAIDKPIDTLYEYLINEVKISRDQLDEVYSLMFDVCQTRSQYWFNEGFMAARGLLFPNALEKAQTAKKEEK